MKGYTPQTGDVILLWWKDWRKVISLLIRILFGIKDAPAHVQIVIDKDRDLSACTKGVALVPRKHTLEEAKKYMIARNIKMSQRHRQQKLRKISRKYLGKPYDFYIYLIWFLQISIVFTPFFWLIFLPLRKWLKKRERRSYACAELTSEVFAPLNILFGIDDHRYVAPSDIHQIIKACTDWKIVYEKRPSKD